MSCIKCKAVEDFIKRGEILTIKDIPIIDSLVYGNCDCNRNLSSQVKVLNFKAGIPFKVNENAYSFILNNGYQSDWVKNKTLTNKAIIDRSVPWVYGKGWQRILPKVEHIIHFYNNGISRPEVSLVEDIEPEECEGGILVLWREGDCCWAAGLYMTN